jgi:hypothetical protein
MGLIKLWTIYPLGKKATTRLFHESAGFCLVAPFLHTYPVGWVDTHLLKCGNIKHKSVFYYLALPLQYHDTKGARKPDAKKKTGLKGEGTWKQKK